MISQGIPLSLIASKTALPLSALSGKKYDDNKSEGGHKSGEPDSYPALVHELLDRASIDHSSPNDDLATRQSRSEHDRKLHLGRVLA
jgi:hypothetical protein